jgi:hypothetical protein
MAKSILENDTKAQGGSRGIAVLGVHTNVLKYFDEGYVNRKGLPGRISRSLISYCSKC